MHDDALRLTAFELPKHLVEDGPSAFGGGLFFLEPLNHRKTLPVGKGLDRFFLSNERNTLTLSLGAHPDVAEAGFHMSLGVIPGLYHILEFWRVRRLR